MVFWIEGWSLLLQMLRTVDVLELWVKQRIGRSVLYCFEKRVVDPSGQLYKKLISQMRVTTQVKPEYSLGWAELFENKYINYKNKKATAKIFINLLSLWCSRVIILSNKPQIFISEWWILESLALQSDTSHFKMTPRT